MLPADLGAGELTERVVIRSSTTTGDGQGGRIPTPVTLAKVWAAVRPLSGVERLQAEAIGSLVSWRISIRYRADVTPQMTLIWTPYRSTAAKTLQIHAVSARDGQRQFLDLLCGELI